jgi:hypothetical protein
MNIEPWFKVGDGSGRDGHDGFKTVGVSAPSERWVNLWSSPTRRGLPPILKSYTLCTAALRSNVDRGQHGGWVGLYQVNIQVQARYRRRFRVLARGACATMMTHSMVAVRGATAGLCGC